MVARAAERLAHRDIDSPGDAREEEAALDLRARDRLFVPQRPEGATPYREREPVAASCR